MGKTVNLRIPVDGMFCTHCEETVRKALLSVPGVLDASASFSDGEAFVSYTEGSTSAEDLYAAVREAGYEPARDRDRQVQIASVLVILLSAYLIASHLGWTRIFNVFPAIETGLSLGMLFVIGLLTSVHCIAMCGGINLTQSVVSASGKGNVVRDNILYEAGRVLSYTVIGAVVGALGSVLTLTGTLRGAVAVAAGVLMIVMALSMLGLFRRKGVRSSRPSLYRRLASARQGSSSLVTGLLNGLMPCGPLQAMQIVALSTGSALMGALSMFLFSLGTVPLMLLFGLGAGRLNRRHARTMLIVSAILIFVMGIHMTGNGLALSGISAGHHRHMTGGKTVITAMADGERQVLRSEIDYGSYPAVSVRSGIPVDWTIVVPEGKLNGCNGEIRIPAYDLDIVLHEGENTVTFTPGDPGTVPYSCWMGMIRSTIDITS